MEFPRVFVFETSDKEEDAAADLARRVAELGIEAPFVLASPHGAKLTAQLHGPRPHARAPRDADQSWSADLGSEAKRAGADAVVAAGGGRCLDVAKLAAARAGLPVVVVPTQLSHDGICSPVAVVPNQAGNGESLGAIAPSVVFFSLPTLIGAPPDSLAAGLGDLLANPLALRDWALAAEHGLEETDQRAWDLSVESFELIKPHLDSDPSTMAADPEALARLGDALVLSGMAMICSGTSRPASGGEHEISHAIDQLYGGKGMHGAQVAFGSIFSVALYGEDATAFRERLKRLRLPQHPADLGLSEDAVIKALLAAPDTRPGRFTVVEEANLDEAAARSLVKKIWGEQ